MSESGVKVEIPHVSLRYPNAVSDGSVIRSAAVTIWWGQLRISQGRRTAGVFLLRNLGEREVTFVTNDRRLVDGLSTSRSSLSSLRDWYSKKVGDEKWRTLMPSVETLNRLCTSHSCLSAIIDTSERDRALVLATIQHLRPETVQNLSQMLLLFGVLHRRQVLAVSWEELHPVVASFLEQMLSSRKIDLGWLGFDEDDPERLIWRGESPQFYA
jgi:hypothetical protein